MNYSRFISAKSKSRKHSGIREAVAIQLQGPPTLISLSAGMPNPTVFPYLSIDIKIKGGKVITLEGKDLTNAMQYNMVNGIPAFRKQLMSIQKKYHDPPAMKSGNFDLIVTAGALDGLDKILGMLVNPGDKVLIEDPVYAGMLPGLRSRTQNLLRIELDEFGIMPSSLRKALSKWSPDDAKNPESDIPKVLYTVPNCGNPTGASATLERKKEIYEIARTYNLIIVEDDPYFHLVFDEVKTPSYQALDVDGRVIRCDSMSKLIAPGLRIGWVSGAKEFIDRINLHQQTNTLFSSCISQMVALKLLENIPYGGLDNHIQFLKNFYKTQRDAAVESANKWLKGLAEWNAPNGGMYLWIRIPKIKDSFAMIKKRALEKEVVAVPGVCFSVDDSVPSNCCRIAFSYASPEELDEGIRRLAELIKDEIASQEGMQNHTN